MSADLMVYAAHSLGSAELQRLFADLATFELLADGRLQLLDEAGIVTIEGPFRVEPEDLPPGALAHGPISFGYQFSFRGDLGEALAIRLARQLDGVLHNDDSVWLPDAAPTLVVPPAEVPIDVIELSWFLPARAEPLAPRIYQEAAQTWFPAAGVDRFGLDEPLSGRFAKAGLAGLEKAWQQHRYSQVRFTCQGLPFVEGTMESPRQPGAVPAWLLNVSVVATPFQDPVWQERLRAFFVGLAEAGQALHAIAEVRPGGVLSRGRLAWDPKHLAPSAGPWSPAGFCGLAKRPVWWSWYGPAYQGLIAESLVRRPKDWVLQQTATGSLLVLSASPSARPPKSRLAERLSGTSWFDPKLLPQPGKTGIFLRPGQTRWQQPAQVMPVW